MRVSKLVCTVVMFYLFASNAVAQTNQDKKSLKIYTNIVENSTVSDDFPTVNELSNIFRLTSQNSVASLSVLKKYDPKEENGFCFGRSMTANLYAQKLGVSSDHIRKVFILGDLKEEFSKKTQWRFHVTTAIKANDGNWYAIDPVTNQILSLDNWIYTTRSWWDSWRDTDNDPKTIAHSKIYVTPANTVIPDITGFVMPKNENGKNIIELSFDPDQDNAIVGLNYEYTSQKHARMYELDLDTTKKYFRHLYQPTENTPFDLSKLSFDSGDFKGQSMSYNHYFHDLLKTFKNKPQKKTNKKWQSQNE